MSGLALLLAGAPAALADHEPYYRYTVLGFVKGARGAPAARQTVELIRDKTGLSHLAETDERGFFVIVLRAGDELLGESLTLKAGGATARVTVAFEAGNQTDERGTRVDVEGGRVVERAAWFRSTLVNFLGSR
ncbi:MAG TPA: hypothetical protein VFX28_20000 [Methylomirabilota bacterium]|nr:hypothetical protein [Methylomirabilota bacterium]